MDIILTIIAVIVIFSILVLIHEAGHFFAARRAGIKVLEFGIGFPPRLFKKKFGETTYSINAIPFGGFVKLYGEDATSEAVIKAKNSYAHKSPWTRTKVVIAGVLMNFVLAIALLAIGFTFGIEPLLVTERDLFTHLAAGNVKSSPGIFVEKIEDKAKTFGIESGDKIVAIDDKPISDSGQLDVFEKGRAKKDIDISVISEENSAFKKIHLPLVGKDKYFGIKLKPFTQFPRLKVFEIKKGSGSEKAGLKAGDIILQMNGMEIYSSADFEGAVSKWPVIDIVFLRGIHILKTKITLPNFNNVVIADVFPNSSAEKTGFETGDNIISIDDSVIFKPEQVQEILKKNTGKEMLYVIKRGGKKIEIKAKTGTNNMLGIALSQMDSFRNSEISVYPFSVLTSITEIKRVRYGPWTAFKQAVQESWRLTGITINAFGRTLKSIVSRFTVPAEIGGPVQIAYYTHTFVQEGFFALLRFTALLSLSLAVINVLPIPALDGGRLLFILIEVIFKKRVNAHFESFVHGVGFILLLGLIILVTYSDIVKLF
ncbi:RIP metalloprotease RseP [Candidatus Peregrinibacteria bacterium]|nr:RIP metalloprotease RseP [Candidatus Peregrinibacteria bacterium]